ncbi:MAG: outer membrane protein assembly factor BamB family protein [Thermoguttaceae bacterium]
MRRAAILILAVWGFFQAARMQGADWPQFRYDTSRSAASPEQLSQQLYLEWVCHLPAPRPAFPGEVRLWFDASYEPVVLGQSLFVPSMLTDTVSALDTRTGAQRWQFFAEGPIRFAPVAWQDSVYFISDDGYLYCVDAATGQPRWKFSGLPPGKTDRKILGSGRLISLYPARGGPVLDDGVIYFGAGIWSGYGVGVYAVDARSGRLVWSNTDSNRIPKANMDHGIAHEAGICPQGYLAVVHETLIVPCGAQLPAFLDLKTGTLNPYTMGWGGRNGLPKGTWFVAGARNYLSHSGDLYDITRPSDERFEEPRDCPDFDSRGGGQLNFKSKLYAGGFTRVWIDSTNQKDLGAFQEPVFADGVMYDSDQGVAAYDLTETKLQQRKSLPVPPTRRNDTYPDKWKMHCRQLWRIPSKLRVHIKAGPHLYLGGPGVVQALRTAGPGQQPEVVWQTAIEGTPNRMLAADGRLFVVTREGTIYAFGPEKKDVPLVHRLPEPIWSPADAWTRTARDILEATKVREGYALVLGVQTGRLVEELIQQSDLEVIAVDRNPQKVAALRERLHRNGLYGTRASVHVGEPLSWPLPPYMASLVVSEDWADLGPSTSPEFLQAVFHSLRPYGGTACLRAAGGEQEALLKQVAQSGLPGAVARRAGPWVLILRAGALAGSADWSHEEADAANTGASEERFVKPPLDLLWFDTPPRWVRTPGSTLVRVCEGRMFIKAENLQAFDVYTGRRLWQAELGFRHTVRDQMVAMDDALYVAGGNTCLVLDPATGRKTGQIALPADVAGPWANLRVWKEHLVAQAGKHVLSMERRSGRLAWKYACGQSNLSIAVGGGKVFCAELADPQRKAPGAGDLKTHALDINTGHLLWEIPGGSEVRYSPLLDLVVLWSGIFRGADGGLVAAFPQPARPAGKARPESLPRPLFLIGDKVLVGTAESYIEYDLRTGKPVGKPMRWVRRGCTTPRAGSNLVTTRCLGNAACIDLASRQITLFWNVRAACSNNLFPASGVLNMPSLTGGCTCNYLPVSQAYVPAAMIQRVARPGS